MALQLHRRQSTAKNLLAHPKYRHPFEETPIHPGMCTNILYQGNRITQEETGAGDGLLICPEDLGRVSGFELKLEGACCGDLCIPLKDHMLVEQDGRTWF